jgi:hypothetical protein
MLAAPVRALTDRVSAFRQFDALEEINGVLSPLLMRGRLFGPAARRPGEVGGSPLPPYMSAIFGYFWNVARVHGLGLPVIRPVRISVVAPSLEDLIYHTPQSSVPMCDLAYT